jgi:hypothetical protein
LVSRIISFEKSAQLRDSCNFFAIWTGILLVEIENPINGANKKTLGEMVDHVKQDSFIDMVIYVWESCNLLVPDEDGLIY